ncbi:hypothetical protein BDN72DRAFT_836711 [Pluteus cervinus]|uniref:Uncharacterized protein n=1 Tax=Pluteus cervinus TaxID=181527 RepID=A0ACD3B1G9_9AGAR|nr:hypothetical protein BDN72DRAFT_836711 [Pluteus cervinus]
MTDERCDLLPGNNKEVMNAPKGKRGVRSGICFWWWLHGFVTHGLGTPFFCR